MAFDGLPALRRTMPRPRRGTEARRMGAPRLRRLGAGNAPLRPLPSGHTTHNDPDNWSAAAAGTLSRAMDDAARLEAILGMLRERGGRVTTARP